MEIKALERDTIISSISAVKNGSFCRIKYKSELPLKAEFKKKGYRLVKITEATIRFGVDYEHIGSVIERKSAEGYQEPAQRENNYSWIIENKVLHNSKTDKDYIRFATVKHGANKKTIYIVVDEFNEDVIVENLNDEQKSYVQNSYWNRVAPEVQNVLFENVISIG